MNIIERPRYLESLQKRRNNGQVKIITGLRRCGKSFLLNTLYSNYLIDDGVSPEHIIRLDLDDINNIRYRNPIELNSYVKERVVQSDKIYYVMIDEIQMVKPIKNPYLPGEIITFVDVMNGLKNMKNVDLYVTGSNSKMLSSDIATEFRGRGDIIPLFPLTFDEFVAAFSGERHRAWREFITYGGMPKVLSFGSHEEKTKYLNDLFSIIYIRDVIERNHLKADDNIIDTLLNVVASSVGSLTNPTRIADTFRSVKKIKIKNDTVSRYLDCLVEAFILEKAVRYDIKGRAYIETPLKYYFSDVGLRNAKINFRQQEENHIMENVLYNELIARGFTVDVGVINHRWLDENGTKRQSVLEVDFVVNKGEKRYYIQSALTVDNEPKRLQEVNSLNRIDDSFTKIVVVKDDILPWIDENGVQYVNIEEFLLNRINNL